MVHLAVSLRRRKEPQLTEKGIEQLCRVKQKSGGSGDPMASGSCFGVSPPC